MISISHSALFTFLSASITAWVHVFECYLHLPLLLCQRQNAEIQNLFRVKIPWLGIFQDITGFSSSSGTVSAVCLPLKCNTMCIMKTLNCISLLPGLSIPVVRDLFAKVNCINKCSDGSTLPPDRLRLFFWLQVVRHEPLRMTVEADRLLP